MRKLLVIVPVDPDKEADPRGFISRVEKEFDWETPEIGSDSDASDHMDAFEVEEIYHDPHNSRVEAHLHRAAPEVLWNLLGEDTGWVDSDAEKK